MRVSMSAMGSVIIGASPLPAALGHAGDDAGVRVRAQADAAQAELAEHRPGAAAVVAAGVLLRPVLRGAGCLHPQAGLRHVAPYLRPRPRPRPPILRCRLRRRAASSSAE